MRKKSKFTVRKLQKCKLKIHTLLGVLVNPIFEKAINTINKNLLLVRISLIKNNSINRPDAALSRFNSNNHYSVSC